MTLYFSNAPKGAVLVKKVSAADNTPLSDVEFLVTKSDGSVECIILTVSNTYIDAGGYAHE